MSPPPDAPEPASQEPLELRPGEAISAAAPDGEALYVEVTRCLGRGGAGVVWEAVADDGRWAVVKGPRAVGGRDPALDREVEVLGRLPPHPNVVGLLGVARNPRGHVLAVLERCFEGPFAALDRPPVRARLAARWVAASRWVALPAPVALGLAYDLALALEHLHAHKLVHCDVKPANVLVALDWHEATVPDREYFDRIARGACRGVLIDLGGARDFRELDPGTGRPRPGALAPTLTPLYAPPEVLPGHVGEDGRERSRFTPWLDTYALGLTLYQWLTGRAPYDHLPAPPAPTDLRALADAKREERDGALRAWDRKALDAIDWSDVSLREDARGGPAAWVDALAGLLERATYWDPARRPTARALREELGRLLDVRPVPEPERAPGARPWVQHRLALDPLDGRLVQAGRDGTQPKLDLKAQLRRGGADFWELQGYRPGASPGD